ncbi:hypothetical protein AGMMS4957_00290 [Bacteroidia bacterium]|nr:hypothetical protein AGMMS4957_00290 [Bacteroidia bacterium]
MAWIGGGVGTELVRGWYELGMEKVWRRSKFCSAQKRLIFGEISVFLTVFLTVFIVIGVVCF